MAFLHDEFDEFDPKSNSIACHHERHAFRGCLPESSGFSLQLEDKIRFSGEASGASEKGRGERLYRSAG